MQIPYLNQILLFLVVSILTTVLTIAGIQVIHILQELRETVKTLNKVLEDTHTITSSVAKPVLGFSSFITGLKSGAGIVNMILNRKEKEKNE